MVLSFIKINNDKLEQVILQQKLLFKGKNLLLWQNHIFSAKNILLSEQFETPMNMEITIV